MTDKRIVIVDDHPLLATAMRNELERSGVEVELLDPAVGVDRLLEAFLAKPPDCAVLDLGLPFPGGGSVLIKPLVDKFIRVVVLTGETERQLLARCSGAGAEAVLSKSEPLRDIVDTILRVADGEQVRPAQRAQLAADLQRFTVEQDQRQSPFEGLSPRERQVLAGLMDGVGPSVLAERNYVSVATVRTQVKTLLCKLGVKSQLEAVAMAHRNRWNPDDGRTVPS